MGALICPICRGELTSEGAALRCAAGHSYDVARSGYVNLHRPGIKSNARSGDPEDMVKARRAFLSRGFYDRYVREAAALVLRCQDGARCGVLVDAACGEGHHTMILRSVLRPALTLGIDAAKSAADLAQKNANALLRSEKSADGEAGAGGAQAMGGAGRSDGDREPAGAGGEVRFVAGNIFDMPLADGCADAVSVLFAPIPFDEARRVLRPGGALLVCSAGRRHLIELRRLVYDEVRYKEQSVPAAEGFSVAARQNVTYTVELEGGALGELFAMTPFCQRVGQAAADSVAEVRSCEMTVSVDCTVLIKS